MTFDRKDSVWSAIEAEVARQGRRRFVLDVLAAVAVLLFVFAALAFALWASV